MILFSRLFYATVSHFNCVNQIAYILLYLFIAYNLERCPLRHPNQLLRIKEFLQLYNFYFRQFAIQKIYFKQNNKMDQDQSTVMMDLIDKLCDHLPNDRIKLFIDNGFDQWQTVTYIRGPQLIELGFTSQEVIIIMVTVNSNAKDHKLPQVFTQQQIQQAVSLAKQMDQKRLQQINNQQRQHQSQRNRQDNKQNIKTQSTNKQNLQIAIKQYPKKVLCQTLMAKCIPGKTNSSKTIQKPTLHKVTLLQLQNKQITHLSQQQLKKIPAIQNLYLANNHIYKIQGLNTLSKIKILRLENNLIKQIQGLQGLVNLERLTLNENYIQIIQNLDNNRKMHYLDVSSQKHKFQVQFEEKTFASLSYCLQKFDCNSNCLRNIDALKHLAVVQQISLKNNQLQQISELTTALTQMQRIKKIDLRGNPLTKVHKYRDYIVILSKSLQQLDEKKILPKQREYLVKLYSLKHAKQQKYQMGDNKKVNTQNKNFDLHGMKIDQNQSGNAPRYVHGGDLRGNATHANTKVNKK